VVSASMHAKTRGFVTRGLRATTIRALGLALTALTFLSLLPGATASAAEYTHILEPGQRLYAGDTLYSPNHSYRLIMQGDGNLVLYHGGSALWSSKTNGHDGANAVMQGDGNFVVYQSGHALWNSHTDHHGGAKLDMQDDGNLVIRESGHAIWATGTNRRHSSSTPGGTHAKAPGRRHANIAPPGRRLKPGAVIHSPSHAYRLVMQGDGNLVVYKGHKAIWSTGTNGHGGAEAVMQGDGNLVVYWHGHAIWASHTDHHGGANLHMQNDGNLVIYWHGKAIWSSKGNNPPAGSGSRVKCFSYGYACTPGYHATNTKGTWAWSHYGGRWAVTANGYHNCTLYAAWRLERSGLSSDPGNWGNADEWIHHVSHNHTPAIGSIAWWGGGFAGHVAYVEAVRGREVFIRSDNFAGEHSNGYTRARWIVSSSVGAFLHPHDLR